MKTYDVILNIIGYSTNIQNITFDDIDIEFGHSVDNTIHIIRNTQTNNIEYAN